MWPRTHPQCVRTGISASLPLPSWLQDDGSCSECSVSRQGREEEAGSLSVPTETPLHTCISLARTVSHDLPWPQGKLRERALTFPTFTMEGSQGEVSQEPVVFGDGEERHSSQNSLSNSGKLKVVHRKDTASSSRLVGGNKDQIFGLESHTKL